MVDTGGPWVCEACSAPNADYRRRCQDCGAAKPADPTRAPAEAPADADPGAIPMPLLARRPKPASRQLSVGLYVVILAIASYGAFSYFTADGPSAEDDRDAVLAALLPAGDGYVPTTLLSVDDRLWSMALEPTVPVPGSIDGPICTADDIAAVRRAERELIDRDATVVVDHELGLPDGRTIQTHVVVFVSPSAASDYMELFRTPPATSCTQVQVETLGRAAVLMRVGGSLNLPPGSPFAAIDLAGMRYVFLTRLELEG